MRYAGRLQDEKHFRLLPLSPLPVCELACLYLVFLHIFFVFLGEMDSPEEYLNYFRNVYLFGGSGVPFLLLFFAPAYQGFPVYSFLRVPDCIDLLYHDKWNSCLCLVQEADSPQGVLSGPGWLLRQPLPRFCFPEHWKMDLRDNLAPGFIHSSGSC